MDESVSGSGTSLPDVIEIVNGSSTVPPSIGNPELSGSQLREVSYFESDPDDEHITLLIPVRVNGIQVQAVVDTAAQVSIVSTDLMRKMKTRLTSSESVRLRGAEKGRSMVAERYLDVPMMVGTKSYRWNILSAPITDSFIIGVDILKSKGAVIDPDKDIITLGEEQIPVFIRRDVAHNQYAVTRVSLDRKLVVPPNTVLRRKVKFTAPAGKTFLLQPSKFHHKEVLIPNTLLSSDGQKNEHQAVICFSE